MDKYTFRLYTNTIPNPNVIKKNHIYIVFKYCNISELSYVDDEFNNYCFYPPEWTEYFDLSYNSIYEFYEGKTYNYELPKNLKILNVSYNKLNHLPDVIPNNLIAINASNNSINYVPKLPDCVKIVDCSHNTIKWYDQKLSNIVKLKLGYNHLNYFKFSCLSDFIEVLDLGSNQLTEFDIEEFPKSLKTLILADNRFKKIPILNDGLEHFDIHKNNIENIGDDNIPDTIQYLDCSNNNLKILSDTLIKCINLKHLNYENNPEIDISKTVLQFIDRRFHFISQEESKKEQHIKEIYNSNYEETKTVYNNSQNVHNIKIRNDVVSSIISILNDEKPDMSFDDAINKLTEHFKKDDTVDILKNSNFGSFELNNNKYITLTELLPYITKRVLNIGTSLIEIFEDSIQTSKNVCFSGRIENYISSLQGFYDDVIIGISIQDQILAKINIIQKKLANDRIPIDSINYQVSMLMLLEEEFDLLNIDEETKNIWINPLDDIIRDMISNYDYNISKLRMKKITQKYFIERYSSLFTQPISV